MASEKQPLSEKIYDALRRDILDGILKPGQRLMEIHYAEKFGVSRTPFREAVRRLEIEGLVTVLPRCGAHVSVLSKKDISEVLDIRSALDMLAVSLFIQNASETDITALAEIASSFDEASACRNVKQQTKYDVEFHEFIYGKCSNVRLFHMYSGLKDQLYRYRVLYLTDTVNNKNLSTEHHNIIAAIKARDIHKARAFSELHISNQKISLGVKP